MTILNQLLMHMCVNKVNAMESKLQGLGSRKTISFVILTWNSGKYIKRCVESYSNPLVNKEYFAEFIVVDNGSNDNTVSVVEKEIKPNLHDFCNLHLIKLKKNFGTTVSRNKGIEKCNGEIVVICDSDTEFLQGDWGKIISYFEDSPEIGIVAPSLYYGDGSIQPSVKRFPTLIDKIKKLSKIFFGLSLKDTDFYEEFPWANPTFVDSAISACWILTRKTIDKVGLLDEKIFYSPEDLDYCFRTWEAGRKVLFSPEMKIMHHTQQISHKKPFSRQAITHFSGLMYYFLKHRYCFFRKTFAENLKKEGDSHF